MTETIDVGGKKLKPCPGWDGNGYNCGRGSPRLIGANAEVCDNCSRGMRKRGQATREEQDRNEAREREEAQAIELGLARIREALARPLTRSETAAIQTIIAAADSLVTKDLRPNTYWNESIGRTEKWDLLRALVGAGPEPGRSRR